MNNMQEQALKAYQETSDQVRDLFNADATAQAIQAIGKTHQLSASAISIFAREVGYVILGLTTLDQFAERLTSAGVSGGDVARGIAAEMQAKILVSLPAQVGVTAPAPAAPTQPAPAPSGARNMMAATIVKRALKNKDDASASLASIKGTIARHASGS
jgi:hypothetical protein